MRSARTALLATVLFCAAPARAWAGAEVNVDGPDPAPEGIILNEKEAVMLDAPELAAPGKVRRAVWSPSGTHVLSARLSLSISGTLAGAAAPQASLVLWSRDRSRSRELWKAKAPGGAVTHFEWLPGTDVALALVSQAVPSQGAGAAPVTEPWLLRLDARRGAVHAVARVPEDTLLVVSPSRPLAALFGSTARAAEGAVPREAARMLGVIGADGGIRDFSPALGRLIAGAPGWNRDGTALRFHGALPAAPGERRPRFHPYVLDVVTGRLSGPLPRFELEPPLEPAPAVLRIRPGRAALREGKQPRQLRPLWLDTTVPTGQPGALVSPDSAGGVLSPREDAVLYLDEGGAWVRLLVRVDRALFVAARDYAERMRLLHNMKHVGFGMMMYAQDYDETLPAAGEDLGKLINPYLKDPGVLDGFVYTFPGGKLADVKEPAATPLGYAPVPGGRAVVYVDGHVRIERE